MAWKKYFRSPNIGGNMSPMTNTNIRVPDGFGFKNYQSHLPEVYVGHPNRIERYNQYEQMDADSEVNAALDILAEFSTQRNIENGTAFDIEFNEKPTDNEVKIVKDQLRQWCKLNEFDNRIFKIFRNTIKYGDQVFVRDPETFKLLWVEMSKVTKVIVNENDGKKPEQYVLKELNPNLQNLTVTAVTTSDTYMNHPQIGGPTGTYTSVGGMMSGGSRFSNAKNESVINAEHIVHLTLSEGLDISWPFGTSILETIFKVFKQKELLEDAIIIYRIQRAPERRVFKIDVGGMPTHLAMAFVERIKNETHQRRIPTQSGGSNNMMDATYNPLCLDLSTRIPLLDGRTLSLSELIVEFNSGKENWAYSCNPVTGEIVPGIINWAGITRQDAEVIELTFDNGKTLVCTPDHKLPVLGKGFVEARDLTTNDRLVAFSTRNELSVTNSAEYEQVWDANTKDWVWTHNMVSNFFREKGVDNRFSYLEKLSARPRDNVSDTEVEPSNNLRKLVSSRKLSKRDTGTLTIDGFERWHDYHTFAVESGIFVKNSLNEDFFFPQTEGGRGSSVEILPGGSNLGEITDLRFFTNKMFRGLRIPSSYLPTMVDEAQNTFSDGKVGMAMIQEWRFNQYCLRLQNLMVNVLNAEFKLFLRFRGINIDNSVFDLRFNEPQNFTRYRQVEIDNARISTYTQLEQIPYFSKRFLMERYLGLSEEEMQDNEALWAEEHAESDLSQSENPDLRSVGVSPGGITADLDNLGPMPEEGMAEPGQEPLGAGGGSAPAAGPTMGAGGTPAGGPGE
jgi:hypothetical protein